MGCVISLFGPTHIFREPGLLPSGCRPPCRGLFLYPCGQDVGSAKWQRGHPPVLTGLNFCGTRPLRVKSSLAFRLEYGTTITVVPYFLSFYNIHFLYPVGIYFIKRKALNGDKMKREIKGLSSDQVRESLALYGDNSLGREKTKSFIRRFFENLSDPIIKVLLIAVFIEVIFTFGNCNWWETAGIIIAVIIAAGVSTASECGSEKAFERLRAENDNAKCAVIRDGSLVKISVNDVVVGDIVRLRAGDTACADGEVVEGAITVDQSALNGESREVQKAFCPGDKADELSSVGRVFRGSLVTGGECLVRADKIGRSSYYGMVAHDVQMQTRDSPLKVRLGTLAAQISKIGYLMALIVGLTYLFFAFVVDNNFSIDAILDSFSDIRFLISTLSHALTLMITVVVVAVPEGLPMMITVVLSSNMRKMISDKIMVKKLVGIETAGSMNILFTDKTGTLTEGKTVCDRIISPIGTFKKHSAIIKDPELYESLAISALRGFEGEGNATDKALSAFFSGANISMPEILGHEAFTSDKKYSAVKLSSGKRIIRGAPEVILPRCACAVGKDGKTDVFLRDEAEREYLESARRGERIIAIAEELGQRGLRYLGLAILRDKIRRGVSSEVKLMHSAGVQIVMITGDGKETAAAIAAECGILEMGYNGVYTREEINAMSDDELRAIIPELRVVSRALPHDKARLVRVSQEMGLVVGMTGDGVNDAPSLKLADVGFGMGGGTDIAKGASDIVILDNSFSAISKTVLYGRTIFKSIRKFISFQLMMNLAACGVSLIGQFLGIESPISIIQMLWVNIIMDTLGGLAFSGEPPLEYYMMEKTKTREERILSREMIHQVAFTGGYTLLLCVMFLSLSVFRGMFRYEASDAYFMTGFYALFIFAGIFNCFNSRSERLLLFSNIGKNKPFMLIMVLIAAIQIIMIYFGGEVFRTAPLTPRELVCCILLAATVVPFEILRRIFRKISK